jgi:hypothetical protein
MDTNQENGVSIDDLAGLIDDEPEQIEAAEPEGEGLAAQADEQPENTEDVADDFVETEFEGKAYKVPKELKEALLRQADYTKKTQEVAETRKQVEERAQLLAAQERVLQVNFDKAVELREIQQRLSQYEQVDWQSLVDHDPVQATKLNLAYQQLQREAAQKQQEFQQVAQQREQLNAHQLQQTLEVAKKDLLARIPDFGAEVAAKIKESGKAYGLSAAELESVIDPRYVHVLHDAMKWRALQAQKPQAMQKVAEAPKVVKPQAQQPKPRINQAATDRLKKSGRIEDLAAFL